MMWKHPSLSTAVLLLSFLVVVASPPACANTEEVHESVRSLIQKAVEDSRAQLAQLDISQDEVDNILMSTFSTHFPRSENNKQQLEEPEDDEEVDNVLMPTFSTYSSQSENEQQSEELKDDGDESEQEKEEDHDGEEKGEEEGEEYAYVDPFHSFYYADRHIHDVLDILNDPDCISREFDLHADDFEIKEATDVLLKCRLLLLRNAFDPDMILNKFKPAYSKYLNALQQQRITAKHHAIYNPNQPTKRYEIMLPEQFAFEELVRNPAIHEMLSDHLMLDSNHILHSLGTVVTEPGAPHQKWHQEDNYLFDTAHSMSDVGVGGHDLPPHVINLFTPLLNLTHDHGPTEFCVGTSATTGLLNGRFHVYDTKILDNEDAFETFSETLEFHRHSVGSETEQLPCPPQNLRSVLLNVGDAVLFDYQIMHRAGHNNAMENEDTRAQIYMAFARKWFRDMNYDANWVDEDDVEDDPIKYDQYTRQTRFAPEMSNEMLSEDDTREEEDVAIESLRNIIPQWEEDFEERTVEFVLSNIDLEEGTVYVSLNHGRNIEALVAPGDHHVVTAKVSTVLSLLDSNGKELKEWKIPYEIDQLVVSKAIVGLE